MLFKQKVSLDESLFDDDISVSDSELEWKDAPGIPGMQVLHSTRSVDYDDDFTPPDYMPDIEAPVLTGPKTDSDTGVASMIMNAITGEYATIDEYNSIIATMRSEQNYNDLISIIEEINNEEMKHVGQLQELLKKVSPNAATIKVGEEEGKDQLKFVNGKLPVQAMDTSNYNSATPNVVDDTCTITNVDDEM